MLKSGRSILTASYVLCLRLQKSENKFDKEIPTVFFYQSFQFMGLFWVMCDWAEKNITLEVKRKMGVIDGEQMVKWEKMRDMSGRDEKILVLVRLRPLSDKEIAVNEVADWECINDTTILYRNTLREGSTFPSAYTFGK